MTKDEVIQAYERQINTCHRLIAEMKEEGDLSYFDSINDLQKVIEIHTHTIENLDWEALSESDLQSLYNSVIAWENQAFN